MIKNFSPESGLPGREPNFNNILKILNREVPARPTLFEFFLNHPLYTRLVANLEETLPADCPDWLLKSKAFQAAGYDYTTICPPGFEFVIAIMGGIDVDFICRSSPEEVYERSKRMLESSSSRGAYALGSGNSIPEYVPDEGYVAMIKAALDAS